MNLKFLLINPTAPEWRVQKGGKASKRSRMFRFSMLTSLAVSASIPEGIEIEILDEETEAVNFDTDADIIGISCMTFNAPRAYEIADIFRNEKLKTVFLGGFHPSFMPKEAILHCDAVCIGESEINLPLMIEDYLQNRLKQFYDSGLCDLADLSIPNRDLINQGAYLWSQPVQATRGCQNKCTFCSITAHYHHVFRKRPVSKVIDELRTLQSNIMFIDDNITTDPEYARELFSAMISLKKKWTSQCSISICNDPELLHLAAKSGCIGLFVGLESIEQHNLELWDKASNRAQNYATAIKQLHDTGLGIYAGIVFGTDLDSTDIFDKTLEFLFENNVDALQATILTPFPGTPLYEKLDQEKRIWDKDWAHYDFKHVVFDPLKMSRSELQNGHSHVLNRFYAKYPIARRMLRELAYLPLRTIMLASLPLNLGYRYRLARNGVMHD